jgi:phosphoribosylformylglycinamidine cyclo-ligase
MKKKINKLTYEKSGVSIRNADKLIGNISKKTKKTNPNVLAGIGGFSSLYALDIKKYKNPVIVCGTDGVGTKLKLASKLNEHRYIGQDLLAMCVNDVITSGATPLFFLDYLATSKVDIKLHTQVLRGIKRSCESINIPLIGGETAEMPGMYSKNDYDLAGFCVGVVDKKNIINNSRVKKGDILIGFESSGFHSNGFSLINKLIENRSLSLKQKFKNTNLGKALIKPTKLYVDIFELLRNKVNINGAAHITGGGLTENLPRVIPEKYTAHIDESMLKIPDIFKLIQEKAILSKQEMLKTFNCGFGMVLIIKKSDIDIFKKIFSKTKYKPKIIGYIGNRNNNQNIVYE